LVQAEQWAEIRRMHFVERLSIRLISAQRCTSSTAVLLAR
jgi:hypothetical protein